MILPLVPEGHCRSLDIAPVALCISSKCVSQHPEYLNITCALTYFPTLCVVEQVFHFNSSRQGTELPGGSNILVWLKQGLAPFRDYFIPRINISETQINLVQLCYSLLEKMFLCLNLLSTYFVMIFNCNTFGKCILQNGRPLVLFSRKEFLVLVHSD